MEKGKKKGITKRALRTKLILLIVLAVIMVPLVILYKSVGDTTPKIKLYNRNEASDTTEEETTEEASSPAEPVTDEPQTAEPQTQAPTAKSPKKDKTIVSVTDSENWSIAIINTVARLICSDAFKRNRRKRYSA